MMSAEKETLQRVQDGAVPPAQAASRPSSRRG